MTDVKTEIDPAALAKAKTDLEVELAAKVQVEADQKAAAEKAATDTAAAEAAAADKIKANEARVAEQRTATLAPYQESLNTLASTGKITVAKRKDIETAIVDGKTADVLLQHLAGNPVKAGEKTGQQAGAANPVMDAVERLQTDRAGG